MASEQFLDSFLNLELLTDEQLIRLRDRSEKILDNRKRRLTARTTASAIVAPTSPPRVVTPARIPQVVTPQVVNQPVEYVQQVPVTTSIVQQPIEYVPQYPVVTTPVVQQQYPVVTTPQFVQPAQQVALSPNNNLVYQPLFRYQ